ncbi:MAG TPA: glycosyltransferase family 4 protein [Tepidisphaeraceae bacterium]|nr:glycosyltransferase family 4 protein [Tepidisphaeraceae bacterium]
MNISILAAGAGGMYCGSCMRDNALGQVLLRLGHSVTLIPLYTPLRSEQAIASNTEIFYGGVNIFLQHASRLFRHTPRVLDWIFDRPWLLNTAGKFGAQTAPEKLAGLTMTIIEGEDGAAKKELDRLIEFLKDHVKPQVVSLPNLMFVGMASAFGEKLGVPVICEMTGEDIFLDAMKEPDRTHLREAIRSRCGDVTRFVATSDYYAKQMAAFLDISPDRIDVVYTGISKDYFSPVAQRAAGGRPTIGYLARICSEKGLGRLVDGVDILRKLPGMANVRVKVAGYLGGKDEKWFNALRKRVNASGMNANFEFLGEVDLTAKLAMLDSIDVFTVPTAYPEAKGIYVLEALARGVPVVQPEHGSFPELLAQTGGGVLVPPGDARALAVALADLLTDAPRRQMLGEKGRAAVESMFTEERMAENMLRIFQDAIAGKRDGR